MTPRVSYRVILLLLAGCVPMAVHGQPAEMDGDALYYAIRPQSTVYQASDSTRPYLTLGFREPVSVLENGGGWSLVRTRDGASGLMRAGDLSNTWILVSKSRQSVLVYQGAELIESIPADLGYNFFADKERRGSPNDPDHWRTPEGEFHVVGKNERSQYHRALVLNYPSEEDAARGLRDSLITESQYRAIIRANRSYSMPPMNTPLGGWIEIHGRGTGQRANWTQGCIAIPDEAIDRIWPWIHVGTPVVIEPQ